MGAELAILGLVNYLYILMRSIQSRSLAFGNIPALVGVGVCLGAFEVYYITALAMRGQDWEVFVVIALSSTAGSLTSMLITKNYKMDPNSIRQTEPTKSN